MTTTATTWTTTTPATDAYLTARGELEEMIAHLTRTVERLDREQRANPTSWSYVGTAQHLANAIGDASFGVFCAPTTGGAR